ncbi:hypothetical protein STEG23_015079 [Scotinomys teguina]
MEVVAAAPRCQLLLIVLMAAMLLPGMKNLLLLVWRKITRIIELQESIGKGPARAYEGTGPVEQRSAMTQGGQRMSQKSSGEDPVMMVDQKPEALN